MHNSKLCVDFVYAAFPYAELENIQWWINAQEFLQNMIKDPEFGDNETALDIIQSCLWCTQLKTPMRFEEGCKFFSSYMLKEINKYFNALGI